jgi:predicted MPP superfamily phosphohydrolase
MEILWIDDGWNDAKESRGLELAHETIDTTLRKAMIEVTWVRKETAGDAVALISREDHNLTLAIVDINYKQQWANVGDVTFALEKKGIDYFIYTNYLDPEKKTKYEKDSMCLGIFFKGGDKISDFEDAVVRYLRCPSFRLIHVADLHYCSEKDEIADREPWFNSLKNELVCINNDKKISAIFFSGDFAAKEPSRELVTLAPELKKLLSFLKLSRDQFFIVPGNHDIVWDDFKNKDLSEKPYSHFLQFLNILNPGHMRRGTRNKLIDKESMISQDELVWDFKIKKPNLNIIGLSSSSLSIAMQGRGSLSADVLKIVRKKWEKNKKQRTELRILLMHHNLLPTQSMSSKDDSYIFDNSGAIIETLNACRCDLVLTGHVHRAQVVQHLSAVMDIEGFEEPRIFTSISAGTSGGVVPSKDAPRCFNVIDVSKDYETGDWSFRIIPYIYSALSSSWKAGKSTRIVQIH